MGHTPKGARAKFEVENARFRFGSSPITVEAIVVPEDNGFQDLVGQWNGWYLNSWRLCLNTSGNVMLTLSQDGLDTVHQPFFNVPIMPGNKYYIAAVVVEPGVSNEGKDGRLTLHYRDLTNDGPLKSMKHPLSGFSKLRAAPLASALTLGGTIPQNQPRAIDEVRISWGALGVHELLDSGM
ncbi:hypothetical protein SCARR_01570 [Pontiella sulfatireligans]|uniref:Uncharacterized protein n=2 Tax=Pontiella sulfatireligans TaxID=2750658 RepID=A0A6C2UJC2_9BACT|nr:hypothetical protein SCARR_01570 [Pontiella sulfatireligans]